MAVNTQLSIGTSLDVIKELKVLKIIQQVNEHATLHLEAIVYETSKDKLAIYTNAGEQIKITAGDNDWPDILFMGIATNIEIKQSQGIHYLTLTALSNSFKTDIALKSRSFQDISMTYKTMLDIVIGDYPGGMIDEKVALGRAIERFTMQYKETDWQYIKRMASHFNASLVPFLQRPEPCITFGIPHGTNRGSIEKYNYTVEKDIAGYMKSHENKNPLMTELDKITFYIETTENFEIGDTVSYRDISLRVQYKEIEYQSGALHFRYGFSTERGLSRDLFYNKKITGLSLMGRVLRPVKDKVKVHLEIDDAQDEATSYEFPYTTMYTAEGNTGWYVMPEVDDTVYIYFPSEEEFNGVGMNSIRVQNKGSDKTSDPDIKYFRTIDGKELKFTQDEILITCANWSNEETGEENIIYIRLNENSGIEIQSTKPISFSSDNDITFTAETITIQAEEEIKLKCQTSQILMDDAVDIAGKDVKIN